MAGTMPQGNMLEWPYDAVSMESGLDGRNNCVLHRNHLSY